MRLDVKHLKAIDQKAQDDYGISDRELGLVADNAPSPIMSMGVATENYFCKTYRGKYFVSDQQRSNASNEFELDKAAVAFVERLWR